MFLSVVAPCFNEEEGLKEFYHRVVKAVQETRATFYEIILVDDGSKDRTWEVICSLQRLDSNVRGFKLSRNFGHQSALTAGLLSARGDFIFIIDSDLQDPPELLTPMLDKMYDGFDVVYGQRKHRAGETYFKKTSAHLFYRFLSLLADIEIPKDTGDFRLMNRKVLMAYQSLSESHRFTRGLIAWLGFKQTALPYDRHARFAGTTKYPLMKMINFSLDAVTGFSLKPLRLIILVGVLTSFMALLALAYTLYGWVFSKNIPGWTSLMTVILLLSCVQLICVGVVGEYVGRTFTETKRRPLFFIQESKDATVDTQGDKLETLAMATSFPNIQNELQ
ncbi:glycosyltransferase family 2 protein [Peredibacter starrii]|uniref:Glycosyltransferase family 2 protein n=1 Tax=Peredibacter starrii TaxID=28202 RepID=A0AAX4HN80_9BACT|nr:glycosyltransferase family 2 protein [Peredibacter starrii]WPU64739.1 glycosyltransferase family 2 protein [Peredibacter starrii]